MNALAELRRRFAGLHGLDGDMLADDTHEADVCWHRGFRSVKSCCCRSI